MIYKYISNNISNFHRVQNQFGVIMLKTDKV